MVYFDLVRAFFTHSGFAVPAPAPLLDASKYRPGGRGSGPGRDNQRKSGVPVSRPVLQRPYSFTHGVIPEVEFSQALGAQLGTVPFYFVCMK